MANLSSTHGNFHTQSEKKVGINVPAAESLSWNITSVLTPFPTRCFANSICAELKLWEKDYGPGIVSSASLMQAWSTAPQPCAKCTMRIQKAVPASVVLTCIIAEMSAADVCVLEASFQITRATCVATCSHARPLNFSTLNMTNWFLWKTSSIRLFISGWEGSE